MALGNRLSQSGAAQVPIANVPRSSFDRSHTHKTAFDFDYNIPVFIDEMYPNDTASIYINLFGRLATQKVPIMDNLYLRADWFWCPSRLLQDNFKKIMGERRNPSDSIDFVTPYLQLTGTDVFGIGTIYDYMGLPTDVEDILVRNTLPLRMYPKVWNEWFRSSVLQNEANAPVDDGPDVLADFALLKKGKKHDFFTSLLPYPTPLNEIVTVPLGTSAPVILDPDKSPFSGFRAYTYAGAAADASDVETNASGDLLGTTSSVGITLDPRGDLIADLSSAASAPITAIIEAFQMNSFLATDARGGNRYQEIVLSHFNVLIPDYTIQRSEYLGGGEVPINIHPVAQTSPTAGSNAQGQLASFATTSNQGNRIGFTKSFTEHGYVMCIVSARADITYQQGIAAMWDRNSRFDFYWPKFQELGDEAVPSRRIYADGTGDDNLVLGYAERFGDLRFYPSRISGVLRSTATGSLDVWHMAEEFASRPTLNASFTQQNTPIERSITVTSEPHLIFDSFFDYRHVRPMTARPQVASLGRF